MEEAKKNFNLIFNKLDNDYDLLNIKIKKLKKKNNLEKDECLKQIQKRLITEKQLFSLYIGQILLSDEYDALCDFFNKA